MGEPAPKLPESTSRKTLPAAMVATQWKPGICPNPGGRPKGLASYIRESTLDGRELADFLMSVMRGNEVFSKIADRLKACEMLMDRAFGKHFAAEADPNIKPILDLTRLTPEELAFLDNVRLGLSAIGQRIGSGEASTQP